MKVGSLLLWLCYRNLQNLVKCITLRRTKNSKVNGQHLVSLPKKTVYVEQVELSQQEREEYELARKEGRRTIGRYCVGCVLYSIKNPSLFPYLHVFYL